MLVSDDQPSTVGWWVDPSTMSYEGIWNNNTSHSRMYNILYYSIQWIWRHTCMKHNNHGHHLMHIYAMATKLDEIFFWFCKSIDYIAILTAIAMVIIISDCDKCCYWTRDHDQWLTHAGIPWYHWSGTVEMDACQLLKHVYRLSIFLPCQNLAIVSAQENVLDGAINWSTDLSGYFMSMQQARCSAILGMSGEFSTVFLSYFPPSWRGPSLTRVSIW